MRKQLMCEADGHVANVAWLSFQPDGSISFGLNDRTFVSPRLKAKICIFNAYNRVRSEFIVSSDGAGLDPILNPHFTYHPIARFHLTGNGDEDVFDGIADTSVILTQQPELPWIRAISNPVRQLSSNAVRADEIETETWVVTNETDNVSIRVAVDLLSPAPISTHNPSARIWLVPWHGIMARITVDAIPAKAATLSWFHEW